LGVVRAICAFYFIIAMGNPGSAQSSPNDVKQTSADSAESTLNFIILRDQEPLVESSLNLKANETNPFKFIGAKILRRAVFAQFVHLLTNEAYNVTLSYPGLKPGTSTTMRTGLVITNITGLDDKAVAALRLQLHPALQALSTTFRWARANPVNQDLDAAENLGKEIRRLFEECAAISLDSNPALFKKTVREIETAQQKMSRHRDTTWVSLRLGLLLEETGQDQEAKSLFQRVYENLDKRIKSSKNEQSNNHASLLLLRARALVGLQRDIDAVSAGKLILSLYDDRDIICSITELASDFLRRQLISPARAVINDLKNRDASCSRLETLVLNLKDLETRSVPTTDPNAQFQDEDFEREAMGETPSGTSTGSTSRSTQTGQGGLVSDQRAGFQINPSLPAWIVLLTSGFLGLLMWRPTGLFSFRAPQIAFAAAVCLGAFYRLFIPPHAVYGHWGALSTIAFPDFVGTLSSTSLHPMWGYQTLVWALHKITSSPLAPLAIWLNIGLGIAIVITAASIGRHLHKTPWAPFLYALFAGCLPMAIKFSASETEMVSFCLVSLIAVWLCLGTSHVALRTTAFCAALATLCYIRPEGAALWPGLFLMAALKHGENAAENKTAISLHFAIVGATVLAFPALWTLRQLQSEGEGISVASSALLDGNTEASNLTVLGGLLSRFSDTSWNHLLDSNMTPIAFVGLAVLGAALLIRRTPLTALSISICATPLLMVYGFVDAEPGWLGNARIQHGLTAFFLICGGAGTVCMMELLGTNRAIGKMAPLIIGLFVLFSGSLHIETIQTANHPAQLEHRVLKQKLVDNPPVLEGKAIIIVPRNEDDASYDIHNFAAPLFLYTLATKVLPAPPATIQSLREKLIVNDEPVLVYMGLYAHYAAGPGQDVEGWLKGQLQLNHSANSKQQKLILKPVFTETHPFVASERDLEMGFSDGEFQVALFRIIPET